jgi:hypothetical protein
MIERIIRYRVIRYPTMSLTATMKDNDKKQSTRNT